VGGGRKDLSNAKHDARLGEGRAGGEVVKPWGGRREGKLVFLVQEEGRPA